MKSKKIIIYCKVIKNLVIGIFSIFFLVLKIGIIKIFGSKEC